MSFDRMMWLGGALLVIGWVLALLATVHVLPHSFLLGLVIALCIIIGSMVGLFGVFGVYQRNRRRDE